MARDAAAIAERPSSGCMPACAAAPWKRKSRSRACGEPRTISPIGCALVVDEAGPCDEPRVVERVGAAERNLLLRREEELDPRVLALLLEHTSHRLEHDHDRGLVVRSEDRSEPRCARSRPRRRPGRSPSREARCRCARRGRSASLRASWAGCGSRCSQCRRRAVPRRRPRRARARSRRGTPRRGRRRRAPSSRDSGSRTARGRGRGTAASATPGRRPSASPYPLGGAGSQHLGR